MFSFQRDYFREARGQHLKIFFYSLFMIILATIVITVIPAVIIVLGIGSSSNENFVIGFFALILGFLVLVAGSILLMMPVQYGIYAYYMYGYKKKDVQFRDGLLLFKKGNYWKSVGLILLLVIMMMVISSVVSGVIYGLGFGVISLAVENRDLFNPDMIVTLNTSTAVVIIVVQFLLALLQLVITLLITISMAMIILNHIDQPQNTLGSKISKGLSIAFKSGKDLLKLFFSNVLLNLIPFLSMFIFVVITGLIAFTSYASNSNSVGFSIIVVPLFVIVFMVVTAFVMYLQIGSFISYYFKGRDLYENEEEISYEDPDTQHITMS